MAALAIWILCVCCIIPMKVRGSLEEEEEERYVYVYVGEALRINCSLPADSPRPVSSLDFTLENGLCESNPDYQCNISGDEVGKVGERTVQLTRTIRRLQDAGRYTCWHQFDNIIQDRIVYVQYRPQSAEGLHCEAGYSSDRSDHIDQLTCHWRHPLTYNDHSDMAADVLHDMTVTAALRPLHSEGPAVQCPHPLSTQDSQCQWAGVHFHPASRYTLEVNVTNTEKHDTAVAAVVITLRDIVKASPVKSVRIKDENSTCVTVTLTHARARDTLYTVTVATKKNTMLVKSHTGRDSEVTLCGLEPYTSYTLSVKCRAADRQGPHGLWSDTKSEPVFTRKAAPGASFQVHEGSYVRDKCDEAGNGDVMILWKAVDPGSRHGVINGYRLVYNATTTLEVVTLSPLPPPPSSPASPAPSLSPSASTPGPRQVSPKSIRRFASYQVESPTPTVADFAVNIDGDIDGGRVLAVWNTSRSVSITSHTDVITDDGDVGEDDVDNNDDESRGQQSRYGDEVTVFRCLKNKTAIVPTCQGEVDWNTAPLSAGQLDLTPYFSQGSNPHAYLFGISRGAHSIQWTSCLFPGNGEMHPPREVGAGQGGVEVRWRRQQCSPTYPVHVTGYRLHICPTQHCPDMGRTVDVEGWESDHCPVGAGEDYVIRIQTLGHGGRLGPLSARVSVTVPRLESHGLYIWLILGICTIILVVLVLLVKCCRNSLRQREQKFAKPEDLLKHQGMDMEGHAERNDVDIQASRDRGEQPTAPPSSSHQPSSSSPSHSSTTTTTTVLTKATGGGARMDSPPASPAPAAWGPRKPGHGDLWRSPQLRVSSQDLMVLHAHVAAPDEENQGRPSSNSDGATVSLLPVPGRFHVPEDVVDLQDCESEEMVFEDAERPLMSSSEAEGPGTLAMRHVDDAAHWSSDRPGYAPWPHRDSRAQNHTTTC
ncbi:hypothetical protein ACOMHN_029435 [Nucella lapillus]